jgi:hypothetical protein
VASDLLGEECVKRYAKLQVALGDPREQSRWNHFLCLSLQQPYSFCEEVFFQFRRYQNCLEEIIECSPSSDKAWFRESVSGLEYEFQR